MKNASNWLKTALFNLRGLDSKERAIQVQILELLLEIERRKAYAELGYDGLFSFCVKELGYTESQAYQRIQAMHAMRSVPEVREKIKTGTMNVTTVAQVQVMIRQDRVNEGVQRTPAQKLELFESFQGKTTREVKEQIAELRGERMRLKLALELDEEGEALWREVRSKAAHQTQGSDLLCLKMLMREWLKNKNREQNPRPRQNTREQSANPPGSRRSISGSIRQPAKGVPTQIRREVMARDQHQCQNCGSNYALQIDHIRPRAKRGEHSFENLRTLCRNCNLHFAVKEFGLNAASRLR